ncbi:hypothetical protein ACX1C1_00145 [Paenibacillus sp. strain BS8-2]
MSLKGLNIRYILVTVIIAVITGLLLFVLWGLQNNRTVTHSDVAYAPNLEVLTAVSAYIIKGTVIDNGTPRNLERELNNPMQEAKSITPGTDYSVRVDEVFRGNLSSDEEIKVAISGGNYKGKTQRLDAEVNVNESYYFFLLTSAMGKPHYFAAAVPFLFQVENGKMKTVSNQIEYKNHYTDDNINEQEFLNRLKKEIQSIQQ